MKVDPKVQKRRLVKDIVRNSFAYTLSSFAILSLVLLLSFVFFKGYKYLNPQFLFGDYNVASTAVTYTLSPDAEKFENPNIQGIYFSENYGVGLEDRKDREGNKVVMISYLDNDSPFNSLTKKEDGTIYKAPLSSTISALVLYDKEGKLIVANAKSGAEKVCQALDDSTVISQMLVQTLGGGMRGSLISTVLMIFLTLLISLPIGILSAIYLALYAKDNKLTRALISFIDLAGGIPTIIYGLVGAIIFIPFVSFFTGKSTGSILSGALTLSIMLLPVIIKTTVEALKTVPNSYLNGSLALGTSHSQSIFKIILPCALPGILSGVLLVIGRIVGESAALIYSMGTAIKDKVFLSEGSATLALHIYQLMEEETPNFEAACGISLVIILFDLIINLAVKVITYQFEKKFKR